LSTLSYQYGPATDICFAGMIEKIFGDDGGFLLIVPVPQVNFSQKLNVIVTKKNTITIKKYKRSIPPDKETFMDIPSIILHKNKLNFMIFKLNSNILHIKCTQQLIDIFKPDFLDLTKSKQRFRSSRTHILSSLKTNFRYFRFMQARDRPSLNNVSDNAVKVNTVEDGETIPDEVESENLRCEDTLDCHTVTPGSDTVDEQNEVEKEKDLKIVTITKRIAVACPRNCPLEYPNEVI